MPSKPTIAMSIDIHASAEKIWQTLLAPKSFQDWCSAFMPGSHYEGSWEEGEKINFIGPDGQGGTGGMVAEILAHEPNRRILARHIALYSNGQEIYEGKEYDEWIPATEEYTLSGGPETHTLTINNEVPSDYLDTFTESWKNALARIKELAENA